MNRPIKLALAIACASTVVVAGLGCGGGDDERMMSLPTPSPEVAQPTQQTEQQVTTPGGVSAPTGVVVDVPRREFAETARSPFDPPSIAEGATGMVQTQGSIDACSDTLEHPLGQIPPDQLQLLALITGTAVPRAMFVTRGEPTGIIIGEGARIGPDCQWVVDQIRDNEVLIHTRQMGDEMAVFEHVFRLNSELVDATVDW